LAPKIGAMDIPKDDRRVHTKAIPRFGGMAFFLGIMVSTVLFVIPQFVDKQAVTGLVLGAVIIFGGGVVDDLKTLGPKAKLLIQLASACVVYASGIRFAFIGVVFSGAVGEIATFLLTVLWIVGMINAMNLIDGLDGLAGGIAAIAALCIAYAAYIHGHYLAATAMLAIAGGTLGFLPYNFNPAKCFMGDCGSQFLGFCLAAYALIQPVKSATIMAIVLPVFVMAIPLFDTVFAILRRIVRRQSIMVGDKEHLHHRIMRAGFGQKRTVMLLYCISGIMGVMAVEYSRQQMVECLGLLAVVVMLMYVLLTDTSTKNVEIKAVNVKKAEDKEKAVEEKHKKAEEKQRKADEKAGRKAAKSVNDGKSGNQ
ncbi:MAG: undecaprenyl/decaprenyl-phosphate alpha-N-acetylglucosaminyl 1-phosphate transferase, partial [Firmicutes bacterium]|nr:undecaprenyl/decaprenyl-phosphate alpha-N-acetylglucosaminyl 1-phosphate transferase [Bacillota bacterium]